MHVFVSTRPSDLMKYHTPFISGDQVLLRTWREQGQLAEKWMGPHDLLVTL